MTESSETHDANPEPNEAGRQIPTFDPERSDPRPDAGPWSQISWSQFEETGRYLRDVADKLGLRDWYLKLSHRPVEDSAAYAEVRPTYGRKNAVVSLTPTWADELPYDRRHAIVHELIHCHLDGMHSLVFADEFQDVLGKPAHTIFASAFRQQLEFATDALTDSLEEYFPLLTFTGEEGESS